MEHPTYNWKLECENVPEKALAQAITDLKVDSTQPWIEYQELMNKRDLWILIPTIIPPLWYCHPITTGPLTFFLILKPMSLAYQAIGMLSPTEDGKTPWLGYDVPDWFNSCLEATT